MAYEDPYPPSENWGLEQTILDYPASLVQAASVLAALAYGAYGIPKLLGLGWWDYPPIGYQDS